MDDKTVVQWWLRLLPQLLLWSTLQVQSIELIFANRKSGHSRVLSQNNLVGDFWGNPKLHTKNGLKTKGNGLITWYLLRFGSNVMKMCSFEIPPKQDLLGDCGDWGVGCLNNMGSTDWMSIALSSSDTHQNQTYQRAGPPSKEFILTGRWGKTARSKQDMVLNSFGSHFLVCGSFHQPLTTIHKKHIASRTGSKSCYTKAWGQIISTTISCHIPGPRFLPSLAPYLRSNASSCDG